MDRSVITGDELPVRVENYSAKYRNFDTPVTRSAYGLKIPIVNFSDRDNLALFPNSRPTTSNASVTVPSGGDYLSADGKIYTGLGGFLYEGLVTNFNDTETGEKEIVYRFPASDDVEVKGFILPLMNYSQE